MKPKKYPSVLFVCKHNVFRSRVAEAYAKNICNGSGEVSSGGIFAPGGSLSPIQKKIIKKLKLTLSETKPISIDNLNKAEIIVIVADNVPPSLFKTDLYGGEKKVIVWKIHDVHPNHHTENDVKEVIEKIHEKVFDLYRSL